MAINPLFLFLALLVCAALVSAADLYKVLDCAFILSARSGSKLLELWFFEQWTGRHLNRT